MRIVLKVLGILLGVLVGLLVIAALTIYFLSESKLNKVYAAPEVSITIPSDPAALERGKYLVTVVSVCIDCHEPDLGGKVMLDDPMLGRIVSLNLTKGRNGIGNELSDADI